MIPDPGSIQPAAPLTPDPGSIQAGPGMAESGFRGAVQGSTLGFGDEVAGLVRSLFSSSGKTYQEERDTARQVNRQAQEANPIAYGAGEIAGAIATPIPGVGAIKGTGVAANFARGAIAGGLSGLGSSEADITKGDFAGAVKDAITGAAVGGAISGVVGKAGQAIGKFTGKAAEAADDATIRALMGAESKNSTAAFSKTRKATNNPETRNILHEAVEVEGARPTTLAKQAGSAPEKIAEMVETQASKIGDEIRPIYAAHHAKTGGVAFTKYMQNLDDMADAFAAKAPSEAAVYRRAIESVKQNAADSWGKNPGGLVPADAIRAEATALQKMGSDAIDKLNPGIQTQVKRDLGNSIRDFVNKEVADTLGGEEASRLMGLNKRMNAWLGIGSVADARVEKAAAGKLSGRGLLGDLASKGSTIAGGLTAIATGNPLPLLAPLGAKALEHAPALGRRALSAVGRADARIRAVAQQAAAGNPFAKSMLARLQATPDGAARIAAAQGPEEHAQIAYAQQ